MKIYDYCSSLLPIDPFDYDMEQLGNVVNVHTNVRTTV